MRQSFRAEEISGLEDGVGPPGLRGSCKPSHSGLPSALLPTILKGHR